MTKSTLKPGLQREWEQRLFPGVQYSPELVWRNITNADSLRLTISAHALLRKSKTVKFYTFKVKMLTNLDLLRLDHLLQAPYYIKGRTHIELIGEQDAMMLTLHANDLAQYLENLAS